MKLIFPDQGLVDQIYVMTLGITSSVLYKLYKAISGTPGPGTVLADLTEADYTSYAQQPKTTSDFTMTGVSGHRGFAIGPPFAFPANTGSAQTVLGYYVLDAGATKLLAIAQFDTALVVNPGDTPTVIPIWGDFSENVAP